MNEPIQKWAKDMNRHFSKENTYETNKHIKKKKAHYYWSLHHRPAFIFITNSMWTLND